MHNNTAIPTIEFGDGNDYGSLFSLLHLANKGLGFPQGGGITYDFHLTGGNIITGTYFGDDGDNIIIALHNVGDDTGERVTVDFDEVERIVYK